MRPSFVLAAVGIGLALVASTAHAQQISGTQYLNNIDINSAGYSGDWANVATTNVLDSATGLEFQVNNGVNKTTGGENPNGFSTFYSYLPNAPSPDVANAYQATIDFTWNSGNAVSGINVVFALDDSDGGTNYYFPENPGYSLTPVAGQTYSYTVPLGSPNLGDLAGGAIVNGFNLQLDPANVYGPYDITFNSITLSTVPEPATIGIGAMSVGLLALRRRRTPVAAKA
jgi:hypothetical protein